MLRRSFVFQGDAISQPFHGRGGICDDFVIPFRTRAAPVVQLNGKRLQNNRIQVNAISLAGKTYLNREFDIDTTVGDFMRELHQGPRCLQADLVVEGITAPLRCDHVRLMDTPLFLMPALDGEPACKHGCTNMRDA